jgi:acetyl esterase/lipase
MVLTKGEMMSKRMLALLLGSILAAPSYAASDTAARFGVREDIQQISLSPDGKTIAFIEQAGARGAVVFTVPTAGGTPKPIARSTGDPDRLQSCRWATNTRLVCNIYFIADTDGRFYGFTRLLAMDSDGKNIKQLSAPESNDALGTILGGGGVIDWLGGDAGGSVMMTRVYVPDQSTGTRTASTSEGFGVERVDTISMKHSVVEGPRRDAMEYISDGHGTVRIMGLQSDTGTGYDRNVINYMYRPLGERGWKRLSDLHLNGSFAQGFNPDAVDHDKNLVYGFDNNNDGHKALYSIALDGSLKRELVLARPDADVDALVRIGRQQRVVGASFATDRRQVEFFDPELKKLAASLSKALPGLPIIGFVDASADESKLLLFAGSDVDPGHYYLYDKATRHLDEISPARPQLASIKLASVRAITFPAADGTPIPAYLTLPPGSDGKNLPTIVLPHGGPEARDEWGFDWLSQFFAARGYAVLQPNFRGSTGYGEAFFQKNGFQSWRTAIGDVNDSGRWLIKQGIADPSKIAVFGWSYGGYAALQSAVVDPTLFKAIVAVAPVTDLEALRQEHVDFSDFTVEDARIGHGPHVAAGSPAQHADRFVAPVLMFHGDRDQNVGIGESRLMAARLKSAGKQVELVEYHRLDHQLDDSEARTGMLDKADTFLRAAMKMPPMP